MQQEVAAVEQELTQAARDLQAVSDLRAETELLLQSREKTLVALQRELHDAQTKLEMVQKSGALFVAWCAAMHCVLFFFFWLHASIAAGVHTHTHT